MIWENLKKNRCPDCNKDLLRTMVANSPGFIECKCGFKISEQKYQEIVSERVARQIDRRTMPTNDETANYLATSNLHAPDTEEPESSDGE